VTPALAVPRLENTLVEDHTREHHLLRQHLLHPAARIDSKYFYDDVGCELFTHICELDEYYPTRTEATILSHCGAEIAAVLPGCAQWIDLGCGDCSKSRKWLDKVQPSRLVGVDIAADFLQHSLAKIAISHPGVECIGVVSDFTQALELRDLLSEQPLSPPVFFYPGSSIGNFARAEALQLLRRIREHCGEHGKLLIGVDLIKSRDVLEAAYDDREGVTAAFNLNVLKVVNRELHADFLLENFRHDAVFNEFDSRIEMRLVSQKHHDVSLGAGSVRHFDQGESILTEYSYKYTPADFAAMLAEAGFSRHHYWTDAQHWFGVFLAEA
tara:strand:- start:106038 stop:107015 length:978 start_codon:yes stop_codon:yes gene_type:complete